MFEYTFALRPYPRTRPIPCPGARRGPPRHECVRAWQTVSWQDASPPGRNGAVRGADGDGRFGGGDPPVGKDKNPTRPEMASFSAGDAAPASSFCRRMSCQRLGAERVCVRRSRLRSRTRARFGAVHRPRGWCARRGVPLNASDGQWKKLLRFHRVAGCAVAAHSPHAPAHLSYHPARVFAGKGRPFPKPPLSGVSALPGDISAAARPPPTRVVPLREGGDASLPAGNTRV